MLTKMSIIGIGGHRVNPLTGGPGLLVDQITDTGDKMCV